MTLEYRLQQTVQKYTRAEWGPEFDIGEDLGQRYDLAQHLEQRNRLSEAKEIIDDLELLLPHHPGILNTSGGIYARMGEPVLALEKFERALAHLPAHFHYFECMTVQNIGAALCKMGRWEEGEQRLLEAIEMDPMSLTTLVNLGQCAERRRSYKEAEERYLEAIWQGIGTGDYSDVLVGAALRLFYVYAIQQHVEYIRDLMETLVPQLNRDVQRGIHLVLQDMERMVKEYDASSGR